MNRDAAFNKVLTEIFERGMEHPAPLKIISVYPTNDMEPHRFTVEYLTTVDDDGRYSHVGRCEVTIFNVDYAEIGSFGRI